MTLLVGSAGLFVGNGYQPQLARIRPRSGPEQRGVDL